MADHVGRTEGAPDPGTLAAVIGPAIGATGCALTVAGACHRWGSGPGPWLAHPVVYGDQQQGVLSVAPESAGPVAGLAAVLGAPLAAIRLSAETDRLRRDGDTAARELADERWQATVSMEQERRGLERDLHDGAQHHLVALRMAVGLVQHAGATADLLGKLASKLDSAEQVLIDTATGILPERLVAEGLAVALGAELAEHRHVVLDTSGLRERHPLLVESTVYFACLEAINNAHKHAPGAPIAVGVGDTGGGLEFVVSDSGPGFTADGRNAALPNLSARLAMVRGSVAIRSAPGRGTTVTGRVPR